MVMKCCGQMFAEQSEYMQTEQFHNLLYTVYKIAMDHYPDGPQSCRQLFKTLHAVVDSAVSSNLLQLLNFVVDSAITVMENYKISHDILKELNYVLKYFLVPSHGIFAATNSIKPLYKVDPTNNFPPVGA